MKILQITPQSPSLNSGGGIGVYQTIKSICDDNNVDYIGPEINDSKIISLYDNLFYLEKNHNVFSRIIYSLMGHTYSGYKSWKNLEINFDKYDAVVVDFTKLDFVIDKIKNKPIIVRLHNVEANYSKISYYNEKNFVNYITYKLAPKREKSILNIADTIVTLDHEDAEAIDKIYNKKFKSVVVPVCIKDRKYSHKDISFYTDTINLIITGSLWFGENYNGVIWFINNVLPRLKCKYNLIVAGNKPAQALKNLIVSNSHITLIDSPLTMDEYYNESNLAVVPIFNGAGMKVKVAEALSYGLPVVGTNHSFIGYKINDKENSYIANSAIEFANAINSYSKLTPEDKAEFSYKAYELYNQNYSMAKSHELWRNILSSITEKI